MTLHKLQEGFIVTSDKLLEDETLFYNPPTNYFGKTIRKEGNFWVCENIEGFHLLSEALKVIAQQDQIDFSALTEEEQKKIGWFDVEKLAAEYSNKEINEECTSKVGNFYGFSSSYVEGFQKAQELLSDKRFTLEDMKNLMHNSIIFKEENQHLSLGEYAIKNKEWFEKFIQSLSQPKSWQIEGEWVDDKFKIIKITL